MRDGRVIGCGAYRLVVIGVVAGLFSCLLAIAGTPRASAEQTSFCRGSAAEAVNAAAVGRAIQGVSLALERNRVDPGETLYARLLNRGEDLASYGAEHRIEQRLGGEWVVDPAGPHGPWPKVLWGLGPGRAGRCYGWTISADHPSGTYRFVVPAKVNGKGSGRSVVFRIE